MNTIDIVLQLYKNDLAQTNEQKLILQAQCEVYKNKIEQLEQQLKEKNEEIFKMRNAEAARNEAVE